MTQTAETNIKVLSWSVLLGLGLTAAAWNPLSANPGIVGKFLGLYFLGGCLAFWAISRVLAGTPIIAADKTTLLLIAIIMALVGVSAVASHSSLTILGSSKHREGFITFLFYGLAYFLMADEESQINIQHVGAVLSVSTVLSFLTGHTLIEQSLSKGFGDRFTGSFAEPNFLAGFLVLSIPIILAAAIRSKTPLGRLLGIAGLSAALVQLFLSQARAGYLALAFSALVFGLIAWRKHSGRLRWAYLLVPLMLIPWGFFSSRFSFVSLQAGAVARFNTWLSVNDTWKYVFIGPGPDRFQFVSQNRHGAIGPHNVFINYAGNIGWLAVIAYALLILLSLYRLALTIKRSPWGESIGTTLLLTSLVGYSVFSFLSYTRSYVNIIFWMLMGLAASFSTEHRKWKLHMYFKIASIATFIAVIAIVVVTSMQMIMGGYHIQQARNSATESQKWNHLTSAIRYEPTNVDYRLMRGLHAWKYLKQELSGRPVGFDFARAGIKDWEFTHGQVENNINTYTYLNTFYVFADTPREEWLTPPPGIDVERFDATQMFERLRY